MLELTGRQLRLKLQIMGLVGILVLSLNQSAGAASLWDSYIPPEAAFADNLRQYVFVPQQVNVNQSSLQQLKVLPGLDEEIALKIMRGRPFEGVQDFYHKLPGLDKKQIDRLIQQLQPKIIFR